jgi:hypothetical protein
LIVVGVVTGTLVLCVLACGGLMALFIHKAGKDMIPQLQAQADLQQAEGAAQTFLNMLSLGQVDAAHQMTTAAFRTRQPLPQFKVFVAGNPLLTKFTDSDQVPVEPAPGNQRLTFQYTLKGNGILNVTIQVVKEGDDWKVDAMTVP